MKKYNVIIEFIEEYNLEVEAQDEKEAYEKALEETEKECASDSYLYDVTVKEINND